jgi:hypothetical protein
MKEMKLTKLNIGQVLKDGWEFVIKHPTILLVAFADVLINEFLMIYASGITAFFGISFSLFAFLLITQYVYEVSRGNFSWNTALGALGPRLPVLAVSTVLFFIAFFAGLILLIIPGIVVMVRLGCYDYAVMFEGAGILNSFKRSRQLTKGSFWRIAAVMTVLFLPAVLAEFIPKAQFVLALNMIVRTFFESWWSATMVLVYFQLKNIETTPPPESGVVV